MGNNQVKEDVIIKCEIGHMVKQFFKDSVIVWYDPNIDSPENFPFIAQLERFCQVKTFTQWELAANYIEQSKLTCHVITPVEKELLAQVCEKQNVYGVYVISKGQENWLSTNPKVLCVERSLHSVLFKIEKGLIQSSEEKVSSGFCFAPIFNEIDQCSLTFQRLYLRTIPNFKNLAQAKNDFLTLCKVLYSDEKNFDFIIDLAENYDEKNILTWFTQPSLFSKVINRCLTISSSDSLQYCRLPIHDMQKAIHEQYLKKNKHSGGLLYRAVYLAEEQWNNIKENLNKEIESLGFFSAYKDLTTALNFMQTEPSKKVLITILIPRGANVEEYGFGEMERDPNHVLFNIMSRFTILEANEQYTQDLPYRHLVLLYGAHGFRKYLAEQNPIQTISLENTRQIFCDFCKADVLQKSPTFVFRSFLTQSHYCQGCLHHIPPTNNSPFLCVPASNIEDKSTITIKGCLLAYPPNIRIPFYGYKCHKCHQENNPSTVYFKCTECYQESKWWCENCLENTEDCMKAGHPIILERNPFSFWQERMSENELKVEKENVLFFNQVQQQAIMFEKTHEYQKLLDYYLKLFENKQDSPSDQSLIELGIGQAYLLKGEYHEAMEYLSEALKTCQALNLDQRPVLERLGQLYYRLGEYSKAEEYCMKTLEASKSTQQEMNLNTLSAEKDLAEENHFWLNCGTYQY